MAALLYALFGEQPQLILLLVLQAIYFKHIDCIHLDNEVKIVILEGYLPTNNYNLAGLKKPCFILILIFS